MSDSLPQVVQAGRIVVVNVPPDGPLLAPAVAVEGQAGVEGDGVLHLVPAPGPQPHQVMDCDAWEVEYQYQAVINLRMSATPAMMVRPPRARPVCLGYWSVDTRGM